MSDALIFVPGLLCDRGLWQAQLESLSEVARCSVADVSRDDTMTEMAKRLLDTAPDSFSLAGLSMGGYVAQEVMRLAPQRVSRLALIDTNAHADSAEQIEARKDMIRMAESGRFSQVMPRMLPKLLPKYRLGDTDLIGELNAMAERVGPKGFVRQQRAIMGRVDGRADLAKITCPTLVMCGEDDAITPPEIHQDMAERLPDGKLVVVEESGHLSTMERPRTVNAVLRYWLQS